MSDRTFKRLDTFHNKLKQVEADTLWKITEYEKLLDLRPTMQYVKSAMQEEAKNAIMEARIYTDEEISKIKMLSGRGTGRGGGGDSDLMELIKDNKDQADDSIEKLLKSVKELQTQQKKTEKDLTALCIEKETGLQKQIDEIKALSAKLEDESKAIRVDLEDIKVFGGESIPKDGQLSVSPRGSALGVRKSTS